MCAFLLLISPAWLAGAPANKSSDKTEPPARMPLPPDLLLEGGRKLTFERAFGAEKDVLGKPKFWTRVLNVVAGEPEYKSVMRPYSIAVDSHGRAIVTDPGAQGVHIFDFERHKYKFIERREEKKDAMLSPQCVALDAEDNIYVTDSKAGKIFVFDSSGKFRRAIGSLKGGEGYFKRPTGIAVDATAQRIYVTDTLRDKIYVLDMSGQVVQTIGKHGPGKGEFYYPTELHLDGDNLLVVDAMNFRVQWFARNGDAEGMLGEIGDSPGQMFRPKGVAVDSEDHLYIVDALSGLVQVFDREGHLLYYFGKRGTALGEFQLPAGVFIDHKDRVFVVDSFNRRVQVFDYHGLPRQARGAGGK
ncbi:MAG TPA: 6-bladed beta-propeller [Candidatus Binatia bacterium]|nr:6-bladed beta-propeller [Candidatus Binatia bacterium]